MRKRVNKKLTAFFPAAVMSGSLCADMTVFAEEVTNQEVITSEAEEKRTIASEKEGQIAQEETDDSEELSEELPETIPNDQLENVQVENENGELEKKSIVPQSKEIFLQSTGNKSEKKLAWSFNKTTGTLTISGNGSMYDIYVNDGDGGSWTPWDSEEIKKIILGEGVTDIGDFAFFGCTSLKSINIPSSVKTIGERAFQGCTSLESISMPAGTKEIGSMSFMGCNRLKSITFPDSVTSIGFAAFAYNTALKNVVLSKKLLAIDEYAFFGCDKLSELTIPKSVSEIGRYVYGYFGEDLENENRLEGNYVKKYSNIKIKCYTNTVGHKYAKNNGISYELLDGKNSKVKVSGIKLSGISKKIAAGKKIKLTAKVFPSKATNKSVKWTSSNKKVATVDKKGIVTFNKNAAGKSVTITATATDGSKKKATYKILVMKGVVKKVAIFGKKSVKAGKILNLKAKVTATKKANKKLKWTSSNKKYATVNSSGKVKTYKAGKGKKVKITADATDGSGKKKSVTIKIK